MFGRCHKGTLEVESFVLREPKQVNCSQMNSWKVLKRRTSYLKCLDPLTRGTLDKIDEMCGGTGLTSSSGAGGSGMGMSRGACREVMSVMLRASS